MNFQDVKLPRQLIADMYKSTLVLESAGVSATLPSSKNTAEKTFEFKGKNRKNMAVILNCQQKFSETSAEIVFLLKILKACNLGLDDIALIDQKTIDVDLETFVAHFKPSKIILFCAILNGKPIPEDLCFQVKKIQATEIVYAPEVQFMLQDNNDAVVLKKKLWTVLKNFFGV